MQFPDVQKTVHTAEFYKDEITRIPQYAWLFWPNTYLIDDLRAILLATDNSQHTRVLQELQYMSMLQIQYPEGGWTIRSTTYT